MPFIEAMASVWPMLTLCIILDIFNMHVHLLEEAARQMSAAIGTSDCLSKGGTSNINVCLYTREHACLHPLLEE